MKRTLSLIIAACLSTSAGEAGIWDQVKSVFVSPEKPKPPTIKVLITHNVPSVHLEVRGKYSIYDPYKNKHITSRIVPKGTLIEALSTGLRWGEEFPGVYQIQIVPDNAQTTIVIDEKTYRGSIYIYDIGGTISLVNEVDIEDYLQSTLSPQLPTYASQETVAASVIAARTHAYYQAFSSTNPYWHVNSSKVDYQGVRAETPQNIHLSKSIVATRYMVLSETGAYEGSITPFAINLVASSSQAGNSSSKGKMAIDESEELAQKGNNAAQILARSFPSAKIELSYSPDQSETQKTLVEQPTRMRNSAVPH